MAATSPGHESSSVSREDRPLRFAILHHRTKTGEHWDLLLEPAPGEKLWTWQLHHNPLMAGNEPIEATRIGDHRPIYLTYEGPISGDRGEVTQVDAGKVEWLQRGEGVILVQLAGLRLKGSYTLRWLGQATWDWTCA